MRFREIFGKYFWSKPSWTTPILTYDNYLGLDYKLAFALVAFIVIVLGNLLLRDLRSKGYKFPDRNDAFLFEIILILGFVTYPAALALLTKLLSSGFAPRYGWPGILGLVLGSVYCARSIWPNFPSAPILASLLIAYGLQAGQDIRLMRQTSFNLPASARSDNRWNKLEALSNENPNLPVVMGSGHAFLEANEYGPPALRSQLVDVIDPDLAIRLIGEDTLDLENRVMARFMPLHLEEPGTFLAAHPRFILYSGSDLDWFSPYLVENKYRLTLLAQDGYFSVYAAER